MHAEVRAIEVVGGMEETGRRGLGGGRGEEQSRRRNLKWILEALVQSVPSPTYPKWIRIKKKKET